MRGIVKYIMAKTYRPLLVKYLSSTRMYAYKGIELQVPPQVFHPGFFFSTKYLFKYLRGKSLANKTFLELGAGSGLLAIYAAQNRAIVTATDINPFSIECLEKNAEGNNVEMEVIQSDLFDDIPESKFDMVVINPPYYKKNPSTGLDHAWYCGENGEYFQKLFSALERYVHQHSDIIMVLCDGCDLGMIRNIALQHRFNMDCIHTKANLVERNYLFKITAAA
jgi:release factor glutamine methyltransferase